MKFKVIIEIPAGSCNKYEIDKKGILCLDRIINIPYPANYGFMVNTVAKDGDAIDIFVLSKYPIHPTTQVSVTVVGVFKDAKDGKVKDEKFIGIIGKYSKAEISVEVEKIKTFLNTYKKNFVSGNYTDLLK